MVIQPSCQNKRMVLAFCKTWDCSNVSLSCVAHVYQQIFMSGGGADGGGITFGRMALQLGETAKRKITV